MEKNANLLFWTEVDYMTKNAQQAQISHTNTC